MPAHRDSSELDFWCFVPEDSRKIRARHHKLMKAHGQSQGSGVHAPGLEPGPGLAHSDLWGRLKNRFGPGRPASTSSSLTAASTCGPTSTAFLAYAQFAAGATGGCTATYTTHWLDTIKVKMQTFPELYTSGTACLKHTLKEEGLKGLYQGATPAVLGQTSKSAVVFMCYGLCEEAVRRLTGMSSLDDLMVWHHASAGAMTGVAASFVLCPLELVKCRLQARQQIVTGKRVKPGVNMKAHPLRLAGDIMRGDGVRGLYRGLPGIWVKEVPGSFIYFGSYEAAKSMMKHFAQTDHLTSRAVFLCGVTAGLCFCITHPIESVKTRVQVMTVVDKSRGFMKTAHYILTTEGLGPLFSGMKPSMLRACIYSGIQFVIYEIVREKVIRHHVNHVNHRRWQEQQQHDAQQHHQQKQQQAIQKHGHQQQDTRQQQDGRQQQKG